MNVDSVMTQVIVTDSVFYRRIKTVCLCVAIIAGLLLAPFAAAEVQVPTVQEWKLTQEQWDRVKRGEQLLATPALQRMVEAWSAQPGYAIELRYPGGEEGVIWVEELSGWLISLAIPSQYLYAVPGSGEADVIIIKIFKVGDV